MVLIVVGAIVWAPIHKALASLGVSGTAVGKITIADVIMYAIATAAIFLGGRIHAAIRNVGYGILAMQAGFNALAYMPA